MDFDISPVTWTFKQICSCVVHDEKVFHAHDVVPQSNFSAPCYQFNPNVLPSVTLHLHIVAFKVESNERGSS